MPLCQTLGPHRQTQDTTGALRELIVLVEERQDDEVVLTVRQLQGAIGANIVAPKQCRGLGGEDVMGEYH